MESNYDTTVPKHPATETNENKSRLDNTNHLSAHYKETSSSTRVNTNYKLCTGRDMKNERCSADGQTPTYQSQIK